MKPYVWPSSDDAPPVSGRRTFPRQQRANYGTLNLFAPPKPETTDATPAGLSRDSARTRSASSPITGQRSLHYGNHNRESTATQEFPTRGLRQVTAPSRSETPHGIRQVRSAPGAAQQLQVVNITPAYRDPAQMGPLHTGVRCTPRKGTSTEVEAALAYAGTRQQLTARALNAPVGKPARPPQFLVDYSTQQKFAQAVRDHAQQRARGVAEFYVQLVRNAVGGVTSSTPRPVVVPWSLEEEPPRRVLTLGRCRDQLVALTALQVTADDLAQLLWGDRGAGVENAGGSSGGGDAGGTAAAALESREVSFRDFAAAFGQNSCDGRLAQMKI